MHTVYYLHAQSCIHTYINACTHTSYIHTRIHSYNK